MQGRPVGADGLKADGRDADSPPLSQSGGKGGGKTCLLAPGLSLGRPGTAQCGGSLPPRADRGLLCPLSLEHRVSPECQQFPPRPCGLTVDCPKGGGAAHTPDSRMVLSELSACPVRQPFPVLGFRWFPQGHERLDCSSLPVTNFENFVLRTLVIQTQRNE